MAHSRNNEESRRKDPYKESELDGRLFRNKRLEKVESQLEEIDLDLTGFRFEAKRVPPRRIIVIGKRDWEIVRFGQTAHVLPVEPLIS